VNAYSADFVNNLEALSESLWDILAKLDAEDRQDAGVSDLSPTLRNRMASLGQAISKSAGRPPLPDPRLVRRIIRQRRLRSRYFPGDLFADPAWDMLLDLTAAAAEHSRISVTSLCLASGVPPTTALRWITQMEEAGLVNREGDSTDRRRAFIVLSDKTIASIARYFEAIGPGRIHPV
jgi:DNA-binding transcriptional ArsR family regulator